MYLYANYFIDKRAAVPEIATFDEIMSGTFCEA
jgi:hypothetical protein